MSIENLSGNFSEKLNQTIAGDNDLHASPAVADNLLEWCKKNPSRAVAYFYVTKDIEIADQLLLSGSSGNATNNKSRAELKVVRTST